MESLKADRASLPLVTRREPLWSCEDARVGSCPRPVVLHTQAQVRWLGHLPGPCRGQASFGPGPRWPCKGTAEGQEEATGLGRASQSSSSPLEGHLAALCKGSGPRAGRQQQRAINPCLPAAPSPCGGLPECRAQGPSFWAPGAQEWPLRMGATVRAASATPTPWQAWPLEPEGPMPSGKFIASPLWPEGS